MDWRPIFGNKFSQSMFPPPIDLISKCMKGFQFYFVCMCISELHIFRPQNDELNLKKSPGILTVRKWKIQIHIQIIYLYFNPQNSELNLKKSPGILPVRKCISGCMKRFSNVFIFQASKRWAELEKVSRHSSSEKMYFLSSSCSWAMWSKPAWKIKYHHDFQNLNLMPCCSMLSLKMWIICHNLPLSML